MFKLFCILLDDRLDAPQNNKTTRYVTLYFFGLTKITRCYSNKIDRSIHVFKALTKDFYFTYNFVYISF